jgi:RimJ/RimL family protein N-acetyltransferase
MNIRGERVALGPLRRDLIPLYLRWANDFAYTRTTGAPGLTLSLEQQTSVYERVVADESNVSFVVYDRATERPIGTTELDHVDHRHRTAEFSIGIGDAAFRGKGYGTEATRLVLDYAFTVLGLANVMLVVYEFNLAGRRAYEKAGFRECGRRHGAHWMGGRAWDVVYMECLAGDFTSPVLGRVFAPDQPPA